ncbi:diguanylate cyclase [Cellvibrio sp. KY-YJ-3]|uniref:diguanylate cyclase n=1 Tax=Cellvibrio sp. KY-YJ-3 TaxID=454662 RepID=UPI0012442757|nr:diguanylate cyclase [Cellvibrio sp. KY-YJ-3]QEY12883.1 diguanylate cyclase [Cellvibrio sp. KY-YJ-3]
MNETPLETPSAASLEQLLLRDDMWMGHSQRFTTRAAVETGYEQLNATLLNRGWPLGSLVEVCQQGMQGEWQLFTPALLALPGLVVLVNPPAAPFSQAFIQAGIDLERLVVVAAAGKKHFISCFIELCRASVGAVLAWQPQETMSYTELRKCQLAAAEGTGLSVVFRPVAMQQQSSPATLRLYARLASSGLEITVFKQKGHLQTQQAKPIVLPLPAQWKAATPHAALMQKTAGAKTDSKPQLLASVIPLRGKT